MHSPTKPRSDAKWNQLTAEQRQTIKQWLFEDNLSLGQVTEKVGAEFKLNVSRSCIQRFCDRLKDERLGEAFRAAAASAAVVKGATPDTAELQELSVKVASQQLFAAMTNHPNDPKSWLPLANWVARMARLAFHERSRQDQNTWRLHELRFRRERYEYDMIARAQEALPELKQWEEARQDPLVNTLEYNKKTNIFRFRMFGMLVDPLPETPEEMVEWNIKVGNVKKPPGWKRNPALLQEIPPGKTEREPALNCLTPEELYAFYQQSPAAQRNSPFTKSDPAVPTPNTAPATATVPVPPAAEGSASLNSALSEVAPNSALNDAVSDNITSAQLPVTEPPAASPDTTALSDAGPVSELKKSDGPQPVPK
jgi:hypothetical protein